MEDRELIRISDAVERFGVSENTLRRRIQRAGITLYSNPFDQREKLVDVEELEKVFQPQPIRRDEQK